MTQQIWRLDVTTLAARNCRRETSAREAVQAVLGRIANVNPRINALAEVTAASAMAQAAAMATGMGPIAHGIDCGGSAEDERLICNLLLSVQGPVTRDPSVPVMQTLRDSVAGSVALDRDGYLIALQRRLKISRA